jgi:hypothetical protein
MGCLKEHIKNQIKNQIYFDWYNDFTLSIEMRMSKLFTLYTHLAPRDVSRCVASIETSVYLKLYKYE